MTSASAWLVAPLHYPPRVLWAVVVSTYTHFIYWSAIAIPFKPPSSSYLVSYTRTRRLTFDPLSCLGISLSIPCLCSAAGTTTGYRGSSSNLHKDKNACKCQCMSHSTTFREDLDICVDDIHGKLHSMFPFLHHYRHAYSWPELIGIGNNNNVGS